MSYVIDGDYGEPFDMGPPDGEVDDAEKEAEQWLIKAGFSELVEAFKAKQKRSKT